MSPIIAAAAIMAHRNRHRNYNGVNYDSCDPEKNPKTVNSFILVSVVIIILFICL